MIAPHHDWEEVAELLGGTMEQLEALRTENQHLREALEHVAASLDGRTGSTPAPPERLETLARPAVLAAAPLAVATSA